jgi:hypothetical protein
MCNNTFGNGNCTWLIIILVILFCCGGFGIGWGGGNCGCDNNNCC